MYTRRNDCFDEVIKLENKKPDNQPFTAVFDREDAPDAVGKSVSAAYNSHEWELFWSDEFDGDALNTNVWTLEEGHGGLAYKCPENVKVENGNCVLTVRRDNCPDGYAFTAPCINTSYKFSFQYGRLEFRAKPPYGEGVWPALWTLSDYYSEMGDELGWPRGGEIDVMELVGMGAADEKDVHRDNKKIHATLHWGADRDHHTESHSVYYLTEGAAADDYHIYAVEWDEEKIVWFVDDIAYKTVALDDPTMLGAFHQKHWIIMGIGMADYKPYHPGEITPLPQSMYVDYVRVYKKKG